MEKIVIAKGDDLTAFGRQPIKIEITAELAEYITQFLEDLHKIVIRIGTIYKEYVEPTFPIDLTITAEESQQLSEENQAYLVAFDKTGQRLTLEGAIEIDTTPDVMSPRSDYDNC